MPLGLWVRWTEFEPLESGREASAYPSAHSSLLLTDQNLFFPTSLHTLVHFICSQTCFENILKIKGKHLRPDLVFIPTILIHESKLVTTSKLVHLICNRTGLENTLKKGENISELILSSSLPFPLQSLRFGTFVNICS